jgi:BlaI family transcriptional regulator, penicillinase repressor
MSQSLDKLTKAEEELMQLYWEKGESTVTDLITEMPEPKPAHSTVSTITRILESKGFLDHKAYGRTYVYYPIVKKEDYSRFSLLALVSNYFKGSMNEMVSFLVKEDELSLKDLEDIKTMYKKK